MPQLLETTSHKFAKLVTCIQTDYAHLVSIAKQPPERSASEVLFPGAETGVLVDKNTDNCL